MLSNSCENIQAVAARVAVLFHKARQLVNLASNRSMEINRGYFVNRLLILLYLYDFTDSDTTKGIVLFAETYCKRSLYDRIMKVV
jgi:hypothetical protein